MVATGLGIHRPIGLIFSRLRYFMGYSNDCQPLGSEGVERKIMARIYVKYPNGTKVKTLHKDGIEGIITANFIRGRGRTYEFSYINKDGDPTSVNVEEAEIEICKKDEKKLGF